MNDLSSSSMTNPYGKVTDCIQFTIDDVTKPFVLHDIMTIGQQYTFTLWLMSDSNSAISVYGNTLNSSNAWNKHSITFVASGLDLMIYFNAAGVYHFYHPQLEIGNKSTDWTPAPEDQPEAMEARFTVETDRIEAQFTGMKETIDALGETVREKYIKTITENENGISITDSNGVYEIRIDNVSGVTILKNGEKRSQLVDDNFYTGNIVVEVNERAQFGNFAFVPRNDGSLSFLKVGG